MPQTQYTVKLMKFFHCNLNWTIWDHMICYLKEIQGLLSTLTKKVLFFKDFKALKNQWWISSTSRTCTNPAKHKRRLAGACTVPSDDIISHMPLTSRLTREEHLLDGKRGQLQIHGRRVKPRQDRRPLAGLTRAPRLTSLPLKITITSQTQRPFIMSNL